MGSEDSARGAERGAAARDALARAYAHRVQFFTRKVSRDFRIGERWRDELESAGFWGLAKALANRREEACDEELSAYVSQRILGAVLDEARRCLQRTRWMEVGSDPDGLADGAANGEPSAWSDGLADPGWTPEDVAGQRRLRRQIELALQDLDGDERRLLHAYMDGASLAEIARLEGLPPGTVRVRFERAARRLRGRASAMRRADLEVAG